MRLGIRALGFAIGGGLLLYFLYFCIVSFDWDSLRHFASWTTCLALGGATLLYCAVVPLSAMAWGRLLPFGRRRSFIELCGVMGATQLAKYVPGNVAQFASRSALSIGRGMSMPDFIASVAVETLLAVLAGMIIAVCGVVFGIRLLMVPPWLEFWLPWVVAGSALVILAMPKLLAAFDGPMRSCRVFSPLVHLKASLPGFTVQVFALATYCLNYLLIGFGLLLISRSTGLQFGYAELTVAFTVSWLIGFLSPGMPAGIGAREGAMALALGSSTSGGGGLAGIVLAMRLATVVGDLIWFAVGGWLLSKHGGRHE
ncbi:lysylphosphatidylglycerol synthase domain-containing protein [Lysobacter cavernae]|uniref:Lysylphosphatidylglycerol synthase domain-containing protein n=1 Tax=Lysobacter cavernae TaxID=1685901 RepID=A0ABV7RR15_9GAMM